MDAREIFERVGIPVPKPVVTRGPVGRKGMTREEYRQVRDEHKRGVLNPKRHEYEAAVKKWRKTMKSYERIAGLFGWAWGVRAEPRAWHIAIEGGWALPWEMALDDYDHRPVKKGAPKASSGMRESAAAVDGWRSLVHGERMDLVDSVLDDKLARLELWLNWSRMDLWTVADLMAAPNAASAADVSAATPFGDFGSDDYKLSRVNWQQEDDGTLTCWVRGKSDEWHKLTRYAEIHARYADVHGWEMAYGRGQTREATAMARHRVEAINEAFALVAEGRVPEARVGRGRPRTTWVVLSALGKRGVSVCADWAEVELREDAEIEQALDGVYAEEVREMREYV
jgi:hypothetical protein